MSYQEFKKEVDTGDILLTYSSKNFFSFIHGIFLQTPITHVALIIKYDDEIYMFESGAPRGVQLRKVTDYLREGSDNAWFMKLNITDEHRLSMQTEMEKYANSSYDWHFLTSSKLLGYDLPYNTEQLGFSCADLVCEILYKAKILKNKKNIFPLNFIDNSLIWNYEPSYPQNILYNGSVF